MQFEVEGAGEIFLDLAETGVVLGVGIGGSRFRVAFILRQLLAVRYPLFFISSETYAPPIYVVALVQPVQHHLPLLLHRLGQLLVGAHLGAHRQDVRTDVGAEGGREEGEVALGEEGVVVRQGGDQLQYLLLGVLVVLQGTRCLCLADGSATHVSYYIMIEKQNFKDNFNLSGLHPHLLPKYTAVLFKRRSKK